MPREDEDAPAEEEDEQPGAEEESEDQEEATSLRDDLKAQIDAASEDDDDDAATDDDEGDGEKDAQDEDEGESEATAEDDGEPAAEDTADTESDPADDQATEGQDKLDPPSRFSEADKATFDSLPPEGKDLILRRHQEMEADYTRKTQDIAKVRKTAEDFDSATEPYARYLASIGSTPIQAYKVLLATESQLRMGSPEEKAKALAQLAKNYGVPVSALESQAEEDEDEDEYLDPAVKETRDRVDALERERLVERQNRSTQENAVAAAEVEEWQSAVDEKGQKLHPHFEKVREAMGDFIDADASLTLDAAYERAIWADSEVRAELLKGQTQSAQDEANAEADKKAAKAKEKAEAERKRKLKEARRISGTGVSSSTKPESTPGSPPAGESLRDDLRSAWEEASDAA